MPPPISSRGNVNLTKHPHRTLAALVAALLTTASATADVVETKSGAKITGKVSNIDGAAVTVTTEYAGDIKIKQGEIVSITTDAPLNYRLSGGTVILGTLQTPAAGEVTVRGSGSTASAPIANIQQTWAPGATDPAVAALQRKWSYEAAVDLAGKTGNSEQLGTTVSLRGTLAGPDDKLQFYTQYDRQVSDKKKSADQFKAGVDYQNNFGTKSFWYVRDEAGFDRVKAIEFYNIAAAGYGYSFIKNAKQTLDGRAGLSHRYEGYDPVIIPPSTTPTTKESLNSAGLDFGLIHTYKFTDSYLVNRVTYVPSFDGFTSDYRLYHESFYELPMANPNWKLRVGISNDYNAAPPATLEKLDTTYFSRLVLNF